VQISKISEFFAALLIAQTLAAILPIPKH